MQRSSATTEGRKGLRGRGVLTGGRAVNSQASLRASLQQEGLYIVHTVSDWVFYKVQGLTGLGLPGFGADRSLTAEAQK